MPIRSLLRLVVLIASIGVGIVGMRLLGDDSIHGLLLGFCGLAVSISGVVVSVFKIPVFGKPQPDSGFGLFGAAPTKKRRDSSRNK